VIQDKKHINRQQTVLSMIILSILILISAVIVVTQARYNPAILQKDELFRSAKMDRQSSPPPSFEAFDPLPLGLRPLTAPEMFEAGNLSDKINGKAELYLSAGFSGLVSQRFRDEAAPDLWIEAFVYDMGSGRNAFAVFSVQRRENSEPIDITRYAYRSANAIFLVHGQYYIELIASRVSSQVTQSMEMLAVTFMSNTPTTAITISEQDLFPKQNLVADSISLIAADAFGYEKLNQVYAAEYRLDQATLMAYLSRRQDSRAAQELAAAYSDFLISFGGRKLELQLPIKDAQVIEILDTYEIIFSHGPLLAGVREALTKDQAAELAVQLLKQIKEVADEP
jgi:hypothetical protein